MDPDPGDHERWTPSPPERRTTDEQDSFSQDPEAGLKTGWGSGTTKRNSA